MTYKEAIKELEASKTEAGIEYYKKTFGTRGTYLGLGLTQLRKFAKKIKIDYGETSCVLHDVHQILSSDRI